MTDAKEPKARQKRIIRPGTAVSYNGREYGVIQMYGPEGEYSVIEDAKTRLIVRTEKLHKRRRAKP